MKINSHDEIKKTISSWLHKHLTYLLMIWTHPAWK